MQLVDTSSLIIQSINLAIILFVLWRFLFAPYLKQLDEEAKKRLELEQKLAKSTHIVDDAHKQAENIIDQAKVDAKLIASEITDHARTEASEITARATRDAEMARSKGFEDIAHERKALQEELKAKVVDVALKMNEKLFSKNESNVDFLKNNAKNIEF